jgi:hypothetical protein
MKTYLAIAVVAGSVAIGGCATSPPQAANASAGAPAAKAANAQPQEEPEYVTGSRIPNRAPRDRMVKQVEGQSYSRDRMNSTMSQPDPQ